MVTAEDLAPFSPRDWEAFLASASPSPSSTDKTVSASPSPSTEARTFLAEVALLIALAGATVLFSALVVRHRKLRRRGGGGGSGGGGGWGRRRLGRESTGNGILALLPLRSGARLTRRRFDEASRLPCAAEADGAAWLARLAAAGTRESDDNELMLRVILQIRHALLPLENHRSESSETRYLSCYSKKRTGAVLLEQLASVPEWKTVPSDKDTEVYKAETLSRMGTIVCPVNMDISASDDKWKTRKELVDNCNCTHPGSEDCVKVHVTKARVWIKDQLGDEIFSSCGLDAMGEQVDELWTAADKKMLEEVGSLIPQNKHQTFMKIAKEFCKMDTKDLAKYYYNVFLPRRLASLTRTEHKNAEAVDTDEV